jgi:hypothetical protein
MSDSHARKKKISEIKVSQNFYSGLFTASVGRIKQTVAAPELRSQFAAVSVAQSVRVQIGLRSYGMGLRPRSGLQ